MSPPNAMLESGDGTPGLGPLRALAPYLWPKGRRDLKLRVVFAVICLVLAKVATVSIPFFFGRAVDDLSGSKVAIALLAPISLIVAYGFARIMMQAFAQLRDGIFAKVAFHAVRESRWKPSATCHTLSLRFHLERKTGGLSRIIERGTKGIDTLLSFAIFSIFPTILQLIFVTAIMLWRFDVWFALTTVSHGRCLYLVHLRHHPLAHALPPRDERERYRRQHQGRRQPAQLRDGQIFQQRGP